MNTAGSSDCSFENLARFNWSATQMLLLRDFRHDLINPINSILLGNRLLDKLVKDATGLYIELDEAADRVPSGFRESWGHILEVMPQVMRGQNDSALRFDQFGSFLAEFTGDGRITAANSVDVTQLATLCSTMLRPRISTHTKHFTLDVAHNLPTFPGSAQQMLQVMLNLLLNALHSLPDRSCGVVFSASYHRVNGRQQLQLQISDQGIGIQPDIRQQIVEPFFSTWQDRGCIGLGLTVADRIVRDHGGELSIDSAPGAGTRVLVSLPVQNGAEGV